MVNANAAQAVAVLRASKETELKIEGHLPTEGVHRLAQALKANTVVKTLAFYGAVGDQRGGIVIERSCPFAANDIGDDGVKAIATALRTNTALTALDLSRALSVFIFCVCLVLNPCRQRDRRRRCSCRRCVADQVGAERPVPLWYAAHVGVAQHPLIVAGWIGGGVADVLGANRTLAALSLGGMDGWLGRAGGGGGGGGGVCK